MEESQSFIYNRALKSRVGMKPITFKTTFATYEATKILGEGGAGRVYSATDESGGDGAIKLLDPAKATKEKIKRFKNEYTFCSRNTHENILSVHDHGLYYSGKEASPFYVMALYQGSLRALMNQGISPNEALKYFIQILDGVEAAHLQGVVHRDLKPENVLYDQARDRLLVADFGIARFTEEELYTLVETSSNRRLANFQYAAPEQRARGKTVDRRADIYALGLILNEMFTGEVPHGTEYKTIEEVSADHAYLDPIVQRMLRQSYEDRYSSIESVKRELIGRQQEFITRQRLSRLRDVVVPTTDLDDPLVIDPPRLVDFDWNDGVLELKFQRPVNQKWTQALGKSARRSVLGKGPEAFSFSGATARISANGREVQQIIDYFKQWIPQANQLYEETLRREKREAEKAERERIQREIQKEELRQRLLREVRL